MKKEVNTKIITEIENKKFIPANGSQDVWDTAICGTPKQYPAQSLQVISSFYCKSVKNNSLLSDTHFS